MNPIIKWAGGKRKLLPQLRARLPKEGFTRYVEPFLGGGALFFDLMPERALVIDSNAELVNMYESVRDNPKYLDALLQSFHNTPEFYESIRSWDRKDMIQTHTPVERAARFIYLNKACFNGLYRVNPSGQFNVPYARPKKLSLPTLDELAQMSNFLEGDGIEIVHSDFALKWAECRNGEWLTDFDVGDFVYLDPPYMPVSESRSFTGYTVGGFGITQHIKLLELCKHLDGRGIKFMLSNSFSAITMDLYGQQGFDIDVVTSSRSIGCRADSRKGIKEIIVRNYK